MILASVAELSVMLLTKPALSAFEETLVTAHWKASGEYSPQMNYFPQMALVSSLDLLLVV